MPRARSDKPYVCGPYKHRSRYRVLIYTPRGDGGRDRRIRSFDTESAAKTWKRGYEAVRSAAGRTIGDAITEYIAHLERKGNKATSIATARYRLDAILDRSRALVDLTAKRAQDFYDDLVDEGGAVDTHRGCLVAAKAFGRFCLDKHWLKLNAFASVEPVGRKSRGKAQLRFDEGARYTTECIRAWTEDGDRSAIAAALPLLLSLRAGEVAQLVSRDVDNGGRLLWVGEADVKTEAGRRRLEIPPVLVNPMRELAAQPATEAGHLFALESGEPADRHWVSYHARRIMKAAKVPIITTHGLRGTHATFADAQGTTGAVVAASMGHESPTMTKSTYIDRETSTNAQIERVANAFTRVSLPNDNVTHDESTDADEE